MCDFRMFGRSFQGLLYCDQLIENYYYWIRSNGDLDVIHCSDGDPITSDTDRFDYPEIFKLAATGFYGPVEKTIITTSIHLYKSPSYDEFLDPCVSAEIENGSLVGFTLMNQ